MDTTNQLITIFKAANQIEAELVKARLDSEDIPALLKYESLGPVYGLTIDGLGQVDVQVPAKYAEEAKQLLNCSVDWEDGPGQPDS
jgi:hypothetical protein